MIVQSAQNGYNTLVTAVGADGNVYLDWQNASSDQWSGWTNLGSGGGGFLSSTTMVVQSAENGYNTVIIAVGEDGNLYLNWQNASSDQWSGWINLSSAGGGFEQYIVIKGQVTAGGSELSGVTVSLTGTTAAGTSISRTTTTDSSGNYLFSVPKGGSYTVVPSLSGYTFSPSSQQFSSLSSDKTQNFTVLTGTSAGTPTPPSITTAPPDITAPPIANGSVTNCNDVSGTWAGPQTSTPTTYSLAQNGPSITGTASTLQYGCGSFSSSIVGQATGDGNFTLTVTSPPYDACGFPIANQQATVSGAATCSQAQVTIGSSGSGAAGFLGSGGSGSSTSGTQSWSRTSSPPGLQVAVDLYNAKITTTLSGQQKSSSLSVSIQSSDGSQTLSVGNHNSAMAGNSFPDTLERSSLGKGQYGPVKVVWDQIQISVPVGFNVLGSTRFSTYNTPSESQCSGTPTPVYVFDDGACTYGAGTLDSTFVYQTNLNGTGSSVNYGLLKPYSSTWVGAHCDLPPGGTSGLKDNSGNTFVKVRSVTGSCNATVYSGKSIATNPNPNPSNSTWTCGDKVLLVTSSNTTDSIKAVQDYCPACSGDFRGQSAHIDTYSSTQACDGHSATDYGNFTAIRLR